MFQFSGKPCLLESMVLKVHTLNITNYDIHIKKEMAKIEENSSFFILPETYFLWFIFSRIRI